MSEQSVMTTPIFDELVNELGSVRQQETAPQQPQQEKDQHDKDR